MTTYELFDPDSVGFQRKHLTDLSFWKHYADEKAVYFESFSKRNFKNINELKKRLAKINGYKDIPMLKSLEAVLQFEEIQADSMQSVSNTYSNFSQTLHRELDRQCTSDYEKETINYRKLEKLHTKVLRGLESSKDKIKDITFKMERIASSKDKGYKYESLKNILEDIILSYNNDKDIELLVRAKIISKSDELKKLWIEDERVRLLTLLKGWQKCREKENSLHSYPLRASENKAFRCTESINPEDIITRLTTQRIISCKFKDFEDSSTLVANSTGHFLPVAFENKNVIKSSPIMPDQAQSEKQLNSKQEINDNTDIMNNQQTNMQTYVLSEITCSKPANYTRRPVKWVENQAISSIHLEPENVSLVKKINQTNQNQDTHQENEQNDHPVTPANQALTDCSGDNTSEDVSYSDIFGDGVEETEETVQWTDEVQCFNVETENMEDEEALFSKSGEDDTIKDQADKPRAHVKSDDRIKAEAGKPRAHVKPQMKSEPSQITNDIVENQTESDLDVLDWIGFEDDSDEIVISAVERENRIHATTTTRRPPIEYRYTGAADVFKLRDETPRRLFIFIKLVATSSHKGKRYNDTFSLRKGQELVMMRTPNLNGWAFGYKKVRFNMKKRFGMFHVSLVTIDRRFDQNLEKNLKERIN